MGLSPVRWGSGGLGLGVFIHLFILTSPNAVLRSYAHAAGTDCKRGRRETVGWISSDADKRNGLGNDALKGLSTLRYEVKGN